MFRIRKAQVEAYQGFIQEQFEDAVIRHVRRMFPAVVARLASDQIRRRVRQCVRRAKAYGLTTQYEVICFVDATYLLGEDFDTDPRYPWAAALLRERDVPSTERADQLLEGSCTVYNASRSGGV